MQIGITLARKRQKVNIVVMSAPPRYDLIPSSCVNNEVDRFNRQLKKKMKTFNNVKILETHLKRECFTKHGLHLNSAGKEQIALKLAATVKSLLNKKSTSHIYLQWKENPMSSHPSSPVLITGNGVCKLSSAIDVLNNKERTATQFQLTKRQRKNPAQRDQDFLWMN
jgi:hypothetical protein